MKPSKLKDIKDSHKVSDAAAVADPDFDEVAGLDIAVEAGPDDAEVGCITLSVDVKAFCACVEFMWSLSSRLFVTSKSNQGKRIQKRRNHGHSQCAYQVENCIPKFHYKLYTGELLRYHLYHC